jgi:putative spermidine/putrescine transport system ATP-binding protein
MKTLIGQHWFRPQAASGVATTVKFVIDRDGRVASVADGECVVVLDGGERVVATAGAATAPGARTSLIVRPEKLAVGAAAAANAFTGRIRDVVYCGDHVRYHAEVLGRDDWVIKLAHRDAAERLRPGEAVRVSWHARDCLALDPVAEAETGG